MYVLVEKGLEPSILQTIERSSLVVEWEQRFIWHSMQQRWRLFNVETMDAGLTAHVRASSLNFLQVSFEQLVQQGFFSSHGLAAFLRTLTSLPGEGLGVHFSTFLWYPVSC